MTPDLPLKSARSLLRLLSRSLIVRRDISTVYCVFARRKVDGDLIDRSDTHRG